MATKNNPGKYDCYKNADPDEPMFILLARDRHAPALVRHWAHMRREQGESEEKIAEAIACAAAMEDWRKKNRIPSKLSLKEAQDRGVCRFCEKTFSRAAHGEPHGWKFDFGEMMFPEQIILNFGKEFAHKICLEKARDENPKSLSKENS